MVLLFDLDGTLTDPRLGIVRSLRYALHRLNRLRPADEILASFIGPPLRDTFSILLESRDKELIEEAISLYRERFTDTGIYENQVYDGIPEMLEHASRKASALYVATSKPTVYADRILRHFRLDHYFTGIYGAELDGRYDQKTDLLAHLLAAEKVRGEIAIMVGDRAADIIAARANGVRAVGVRWGYGSEQELIEAGADILCRIPGEFARCLSQMAI